MVCTGTLPGYPHFVGLPPLNDHPHLTRLCRRQFPTLSHRRLAILAAAQQGSSTIVDRVLTGVDVEGDVGVSEKSIRDYFNEAAVLVKSTGDGGGPRWFSPVECGAPRLKDVPLLIYLPGVDGVGLGLVRHHRKLGMIFEVWCFHIPPADRASFPRLVKLVDDTVKSEHSRSPNRPIYLVGESFGACLALAVASRNPDIDLVLILINPATSFTKSPLRLTASFLAPFQPLFRNTSLLKLLRGAFVMPFVDASEEALEQSKVVRDLLQAISDIFPGDSFTWKMKMLHDACSHANSRLHAIKAQSLILCSGRDPLLPSQEEGETLRRVLLKCDIRKFNDSGHFLLLEDGLDLVETLKGTSYYRRGITHDYIADFLRPTPSEFKRLQDQCWWYDTLFSPVMLSTLNDGKVVKGFDGIPLEGPTLLVGNHMLMAFDCAPLVLRIFAEKNIVLRVIAHPLFFFRLKEGKLPDVSSFDNIRMMGCVPVSGRILFKLLQSKSHILLFPGGVREAFHRKGEEYQLFWPEESEFVRMAARFGAKIIPFGAVGEDDFCQMVLDYDDLVRIPYFKAEIEELAKETVTLRSDDVGEVSNQQIYLPGMLPKIPGRFYFFFGKPIELAGRKHELKDRHKAQELYTEIKAKVEECLAYLKDKRETDPYRSLISRLLYMSAHGPSSEIPTFEH